MIIHYKNDYDNTMWLLVIKYHNYYYAFYFDITFGSQIRVFRISAGSRYRIKENRIKEM